MRWIETYQTKFDFAMEDIFVFNDLLQVRSNLVTKKGTDPRDIEADVLDIYPQCHCHGDDVKVNEISFGEWQDTMIEIYQTKGWPDIDEEAFFNQEEEAIVRLMNTELGAKVPEVENDEAENDEDSSGSSAESSEESSEESSASESSSSGD